MPPLHHDSRTEENCKLYHCEDTNNNNNNRLNSKKRKSQATTTTSTAPTPMNNNEYYVDAASSMSSLPLNHNNTNMTTTKTTTNTTPWVMLRLWLVGNSLFSVAAWIFFQNIPITILAFGLPFTIAFVQGSLLVLNFRVKYGDSPLPKAPSHGIVKCSSGGTSTSSGQVSVSVPAVLPNHQQQNQQLQLPEAQEETSTPLRLLVIGDSLAIGVGQSTNATPVLPEAIAKSLSKAMGGRPVLWTCHGAPGASAGWIVRELERSIQQGQFLQTTAMAGHRHRTVMEHTNNTILPMEENQTSADASSVDESSSDTTSSSNSSEDEETQTWHERLRHERIQFDPQVVGPFDVAIVMTGSNDLKSAFFPFMLTGEDAEFRRQAQLRGGGYAKELTRIIQVLNRRMRLRLQTLRDQMEAATEKMRERLGSVDNNTNNNNHSTTIPTRRTSSSASSSSASSSFRRTSSRHNSTTPTTTASSSSSSSSLHEEDEVGRIQQELEDCLSRSSSSTYSSSLFPMVVLPGMPARALPIFQRAPLRWLAVPIVDIMDSHKRNLAKRHHGDVLFVDAPSPHQMADYSAQRGTPQDEYNLELNLRDIKRRHARRIEADMKDYYYLRRNNNNSNTALSMSMSSSMSSKVEENHPEMTPLRERERGHLQLMSADGIHPNDEGYEFWGRHIAQAIVHEWKQKQQQSGDTPILE